MPRERRWHFQARQHGAERGPLADLRSPISEEADAGLRMRPGAVRQTRRSTRDLRAGRGDLRPGCVDPRHLRSLLAGPGGARYTTLVSKHSETSDETDSHPGDAAGEQGLAVVTEVLEPADLPAFDGVALLQVGARNMQNFPLLKALGQLRRPVLLKRGLAATVEEWLLAAEYLLAGGNDQVILCERGVRGFEPSTRNMLDLSAVVIAKQRTHLPVMVDPSHASGRRELVIPLSLAAAAAGADGLLVEVHPRPSEALG